MHRASAPRRTSRGSSGTPPAPQPPAAAPCTLPTCSHPRPLRTCQRRATSVKEAQSLPSESHRRARPTTVSGEDGADSGKPRRRRCPEKPRVSLVTELEFPFHEVGPRKGCRSVVLSAFWASAPGRGSSRNRPCPRSLHLSHALRTGPGLPAALAAAWARPRRLPQAPSVPGHPGGLFETENQTRTVPCLNPPEAPSPPGQTQIPGHDCTSSLSAGRFLGEFLWARTLGGSLPPGVGKQAV